MNVDGGGGGSLEFIEHHFGVSSAVNLHNWR